MRAFRYRSAASGATQLRKVAKRLAAKLGKANGAKVEVFDGYLLRALGSDSAIVVTALDPAALWLFLNHQTPPGGELQRLLGVCRFDRGGVLAPAPAPSTPEAPSADNALTRWAPVVGYVGSVDTGALGLLPGTPAVPTLRHDRIGTVTLGSSAGYVIGAVSFATRFQLYGVALDPMRAKLVPPARDMNGTPISAAEQTDWVLPESGLQALLGDSHARLIPRLASTYPWYSVPTFAAQTARDGWVQTDAPSPAWYADVVLAGAYVAQDQASPRLGVAGVFLARVRRPTVLPGANYPLTAVWSRPLPLTGNTDAEFVPAVVTPSGEDPRRHAHGITGVGLAYSAGDGTTDTSLLVAGVHCMQGDVASPTRWVGLQAHTVSLDGVRTSITLRKTTAATQWHVGHEVALFGVNGVGVVEMGVAGGVIDQASARLWHVGTDRGMRETGLYAAGWYPFTDYLLNPTDPTSGALFGQVTRPWCALGDGKVAVLARNYTVPADAAAVTWTLVVLDQTTGAFIEARGTVATDASTVSSRAFLSVIVPEHRKADGTVVPAVLLGALGSKTRISRDGGLTWTLLFDGYVGLPVYLGNRLHPVALEQNL